jgi:hypothetical protein
MKYVEKLQETQVVEAMQQNEVFEQPEACRMYHEQQEP